MKTLYIYINFGYHGKYNGIQIYVNHKYIYIEIYMTLQKIGMVHTYNFLVMWEPSNPKEIVNWARKHWWKMFIQTGKQHKCSQVGNTDCNGRCLNEQTNKQTNKQTKKKKHKETKTQHSNSRTRRYLLNISHNMYIYIVFVITSLCPTHWSYLTSENIKPLEYNEITVLAWNQTSR